MRVLPSGIVTFVFSDIEGSTRLLQSLGSSFGTVLDEHRRIIRHRVEEFGGAEVKTDGDGLFLAFDDAASAVRACVLAQRDLSRYRFSGDVIVRVRMGMHTGRAQPTDGDYVAIAVNQAARIASAAHGGQVLVSRQTADDFSASSDGIAFRSLGRYRLKDFTEPAELLQVVHPELPTEFPAPRALPSQAHNLQLPRTSFVGREVELLELCELVRTRTLVTVIGPGGAGKTRLSNQAALAVAGEFPDGAWSIALAPIEDPSMVASAAASVLGIREQPGHPLVDTMIDVLATKRLLLVIDNCEHVLGEAASLISALLDGCGGLRILATSRGPTGVSGEQLYPLAPMMVPEENQSLGKASSNDAVRLFVERARAASPRFDVDEDNIAAITDLCRKVDGIPLAIELAAARIRGMSVHDLADRVGKTVELLSTSAPVPERQQTVRALIEWSERLLEPDARILFRRLGAFRSSFTIEAAEAVCSDENLPRGAITRGLWSLLDQSLILSAAEDEPRYRMLTLVRAIAGERLSEAGERETLSARYRAWFFERIGPGVGDDVRICRVRADLDEFLAAASVVVEGVANDDGMLLAAFLAPVLRRLGLPNEGEALLRANFAAGASPAAAIEGYLALSHILAVQSRNAEYAKEWEHAKAIAGMLPEAQRRAFRGRILFNEGRLARLDGDTARAEALLHEAIRVEREGDEQGVPHNELGILLVDQNRIDEGIAVFEQVLALAGSTPEATLWGLRAIGNLAEAVRRRGDVRRAFELESQSAELSARLGDREALGFSFVGLGLDLLTLGDAERAVRLLTAGERTLNDTGGRLFDIDRINVDAALLKAAQQLGAEKFDTARTDGEGLSAEAALALAALSNSG